MLSSKKTKREDDDQEAQRLSSNQQKQQGKDEESSDESLELSEDALFAKKIDESEKMSEDALFAKKISESEETSEEALFAKKIDESELFEEDEKFVEDSIDEESILNQFSLDSMYLYRAENYSEEKDISKENTPLTGFFSPSYEYAADYHESGSKDTNYDSIIRVELNKPIGVILIELIKSSDAFAQNLGNIKKDFEELSATKPDHKRVKNARKRQGLIDGKGGKGKGYDWSRMGAKGRKNAPNAVMIKREVDVINIEITSRMEELVNKKKILVEHPLDKYVVSIDRMEVAKTKDEDLD